MKLVIDISEEEYNLIKIKSESNIGGVPSEAERVIAKGIPLPKGHGELKDVSNLLTVTDYDGKNEKTYVLYDEIKHAPIIIEADKGGE